jgi:DNA adenine methylase
MKYLGGKQRLGKHISPIIQSYYNDELNGYLEPFCGSLGVLKHMTNLPLKIHANDYHPDLIQMWKEVQKDKFEYPESISEEEYNTIKEYKSPNALKSFTGFGMSFGGRFFGAYSQKYLGNKKEDFCKEMTNSLKRIQPLIKKVKFTCQDYRKLKPKNLLIYCDPPYKQTKYPIKYRRDTKFYDEFDNEEFWEIMRIWSKDNIVIISETTSPDDFICIWEQDVSRSASKSKNTKKIESLNTEKLFMFNV